MSTLKDLLALGFTPAAGLAICACIVLWARVEWGTRKQNATREEWHAETLSRVKEMEGHVDACNEDRETLKSDAAALKLEVATLSERTLRISKCPLKTCPNRLP